MKRDDLLTTRLDDEVVVYDPETKQAHSLNSLAVAVWTHADDATTVGDLQRRVSDDIGVPIDEATVVSALRQLQKAHLLLNKVTASGPLTRRELLGKGGKLGAVAIVTPMIASALVPMAAAAASACPVPGNCATGLPFPTCATAPNGTTCYCAQSTEGTTACVGNWLCGNVGTCSSTSQCPAGSTCVVNSYCTCGTPTGNCAPACGAGIAPQTTGQTAFVR